MKFFAFILSFFLLTGCTAVKKIFSKEKTKVEVSEFQQMTSVEVTETEAFVNVLEFTQEDINVLLSGLSFGYVGETNEDSASFELTKTDTGIRIQVSGKAKSNYTETTADKTESKNHIAEVSNKVSVSKNTEFNRQTDLSIKMKDKIEQKEKFKLDFSGWFWIALILIGSLFVYLIVKRKSKLNA